MCCFLTISESLSKQVLIAVVLLLLGSVSPAQQTLPDSIPETVQRPELGPNDTILVPAKISEGQIYAAGTLDWVWVSGKMSAAARKRRAEWTRLRNAVYVTYPYARKAGAIMNEINIKTAGLAKEKKKQYIKTREKELKKEFADPLSNLSVYQGKVLMKLINRQTGNNCFDIIKEYKGGVTARFYQTVAFFFNSSLKQDYNAQSTDKELEKIVIEVERMYQ